MSDGIRDAEGKRAVRVQRKRTRGWKMPENTVYVGRPGKWGNPHRVTTMINAENAVRLFREYLEANQAGSERFRLPLSELRGKNLACFCRLDQPCHADVLLEVANA